ncbi:cleavage factor two protein 2 [Trichomonascus vanleenenianus]|uniref:cleavage polyadenylation factor subunit CFT2 n=1 Tax=Trichomonascus vanleenenianus TaxID=2268995 RepID=UPI003ECA693E
MFDFTALAPSDEDNILGQVYQSLLSFTSPSINLLIDVGWNPDLSMDLSAVQSKLMSVDAILLTHATISHLGAYAYLYKVVPEIATIPVYATLPVVNMGRIITLDAYRSRGLLGPIGTAQLSVQDVEAAFDKIEALKYSQSFKLQGKLEGITITPHNAGHTLGGTIWKIQKDYEDIVYAVDWNHSRDSFLNGAFMQQGTVAEALSRPSILICGTKTGEGVTMKTRKKNLITDINETLSNGGTVLIPTSSGSRALELVHLLDTEWARSKRKEPLIYLSHVGRRMLAYASSMLEWMSAGMINEWQDKNQSPFDTKHLRTVTSVDELAEGPKVVLAAGEALETGFSRSYFASICRQENSLVILTENAGKDTLAEKLYQAWEKEQVPNSGESEDMRSVALTTKLGLSYTKELPLEGEELFNFNEKLRKEKEEREKQAAMEQWNKNLLEKEQDEMSSDESDEEAIEAVDKMGIESLIRGEGVHDYDVRNFKGKHRMFPYSLKRKRIDDYGEVIKPEDFAVANESNEPIEPVSQNQKGQKKKKGKKTGEKHKWGQSAKDDETHKLDATSGYAVPVKQEIVTEEIKVLCRVDFVDFEGLTDATSLEMIITSVQPKKLIVIPNCATVEFGKNKSPEHLEEVCLNNGISSVTFAAPNELIHASINSFAFSVKISPELEKLLQWQKILGEYQVAHVLGRLDMQQTEQQAKAPGSIVDSEGDTNTETVVEGGDDEGEASKEAVLVPLSTVKELSAAPRMNPLLVGDIKLAELKRKLIAQGHKAEFGAEGILVCDDKVAVRKLEEGRLIIEGGVDNEFYETKNVVRQLLAIV